jgi:ATP-dependent RNA helicase RhlE
VTRILDSLPRDRQNLLFSATMPKAIRSLADRILRDPHVVELANTRPAETIEHFLYEIGEGQKRSLLERVLGEEDCKTAIVFTRTKHRAKRMAQQLEAKGLKAVALQGNMSQSQRDRAMQGFRKGTFDILVATDIAARGLDVAGIDYVINFDPPSTPDTYTHRIGRTGRSEARGKAVTFVTGEDRLWVRDTERVLGSKIPRLVATGLADAPSIDRVSGDRGPERSGQGRGRSRSGARPGSRSGSPSGARSGGRSESGAGSRRRSRDGRSSTSSAPQAFR